MTYQEIFDYHASIDWEDDIEADKASETLELMIFEYADGDDDLMTETYDKLIDN